MGTNYYVATNFCEHCKRFDRDKHIGKSSGGWTFSFRGYRADWDMPKIETYEHWLLALQGERICDEYGEEISLADFQAMVESKKNEKFNHTIYCRREHPRHAEQDCWLDPEGHSFDAAEFS